MNIGKPIPHTDAKIVNGVYLPNVPCYRKPASEFVVIDWLSFTFSIFSIETMHFVSSTSDEREYKKYLQTVAYLIADELESIIGFGIDCEVRPKNHYEVTYQLQNNAGTINLGGQKNTVLVTINGTGCTYSENAFEYHLADYMRTLHRLKITRLDLAYDDLDGQLISPEWADEQDDKGGFARTNRYPEIEKRGDWKRPNGKGLSFYVGSTQSSKRCVFYEKGKQLGDKNSKWTRCELRLKGKGYHIPIDAIESPTGYFITAYPCFEHLFDSSDITLKKFELIKKSETISIAKSMQIVKNQFGKHLYAFEQQFSDRNTIYDLLTEDKKEIPKRMSFLDIHNRTHILGDINNV